MSVKKSQCKILCLCSKISEPDVEKKTEKKARVFGLVYLIDENPPWHISLLLGFQVRAIRIRFFYFLHLPT